jgi:hypothetical protein
MSRRVGDLQVVSAVCRAALLSLFRRVQDDLVCRRVGDLQAAARWPATTCGLAAAGDDLRREGVLWRREDVLRRRDGVGRCRRRDGVGGWRSGDVLAFGCRDGVGPRPGAGRRRPGSRAGAVSVAGAADSAGWLDVRVRSVGVFFLT